MPDSIHKIRIGTRGSVLAIWQAKRVRELLTWVFQDAQIEIVAVKTGGDRDRKTPLNAMGGAGVFVKELEKALDNDRVDAAVHSAKDIPVNLMDGMTIPAVLPRGPVEDALVSGKGLGLMNLPSGALIGTSSPRRAAQLLAIRKDLKIMPIRGNVETRLRKVANGEYDATVLARAGLVRLGREEYITEVLDEEKMLPAPGQGIIAIECRQSDAELCKVLAYAGDRKTFKELQAERGFLAGLQAGCSAAVAGRARFDSKGRLTLRGKVLSLDGETTIETETIADENEHPSDLGKRAASILLKNGADMLLTVDE